MYQRFIINVILLVFVASGVRAQTEAGDSVALDTTHTEKRGFKRFLSRFVHAVTEMDTNYCVKNQGDFSIDVRTSISQEVLTVNTADGLHMKMASELAYKIGPYIGYGPLKMGYLFRVNPTGRRKAMDFSFSVNTNLFNIDFILRRTGGDFNMREVSYPNDQGITKMLFDGGLMEKFSNDTYNTLIGCNVSWIPNHRKFSNSAASAYGSVQIKSAGSPIIGVGYTQQKLETDMSELTSAIGFMYLLSNAGKEAYNNPDIKAPDGTTFKQEADAFLAHKEGEDVFPIIKKIVMDFHDIFLAEKYKDVRQVLFNAIPTTTRVYDWHLQLGYAYNFVINRHLMVGAQLCVFPGVKRFTADNSSRSLGTRMIQEEPEFAKKYMTDYGITPTVDIDRTSFGCNVNARISIRFHWKRWYAGTTGIFNGYYYNRSNFTMNNRYWTVLITAGYGFRIESLMRRCLRRSRSAR